jgi:mono/diheme cytochrome c family protein
MYRRRAGAALSPTWTILALATILTVAAWGPLHADPGTQTKALPYRVVDGKVDRSTYLGWRVFHSVCHGCHGVDATGTTVAPDLVERIKDMDARAFTIKVLTRYRITLGSGEVVGDDDTALRQAFLEQVLRHERGELIMPAWERDTNVKPHVLDIYAYLRARADGALGPGRPEQIP